VAKTICRSGEAIRGRVVFLEACRSLGFSAIPANVPALGKSICCALSAGVCSCVMSLALGLASVLSLGSVVHAVLA